MSPPRSEEPLFVGQVKMSTKRAAVPNLLLVAPLMTSSNPTFESDCLVCSFSKKLQGTRRGAGSFQRGPAASSWSLQVVPL